MVASVSPPTRGPPARRQQRRGAARAGVSRFAVVPSRYRCSSLRDRRSPRRSQAACGPPGSGRSCSRSAGITPRLHYYGPIRHPLVFRRLPGSPGYTAYLAPPHLEAGRGGLLQLLSASLSPCRRCYPAEVARHVSQRVPFDAAFTRFSEARPSGLPRFGATPAFAHTAARGLAHHPLVALSIGFRASISLLPAIRATGRPAVAPAGLSPAERASLSWTHGNHRTVSTVTTRHPPSADPALLDGTERPPGPRRG